MNEDPDDVDRRVMDRLSEMLKEFDEKHYRYKTVSLAGGPFDRHGITLHADMTHVDMDHEGKTYRYETVAGRDPMVMFHLASP